jgi:hypothetical protein
MRAGIGAGDGRLLTASFIGPRREWRGGEAANGGGFLIPVSFNIESGRGVDEAPS